MVALGLDPIAALRTVCGAEVVDKMIEDVYNTLRGGDAVPPPASAFPEYAKPGQRLPRLRERVAYSGRNRRPFLAE
jgi:hypothetical protein